MVQLMGGRGRTRRLDGDKSGLRCPAPNAPGEYPEHPQDEGRRAGNDEVEPNLQYHPHDRGEDGEKSSDWST